MKLEKGRVYTWGEVYNQLMVEKTTLAISPLPMSRMFFDASVKVDDIIDLSYDNNAYYLCRSQLHCDCHIEKIIILKSYRQE